MGNLPDGTERYPGMSNLPSSFSSSVYITLDEEVTAATAVVWAKGEVHRPGSGSKVTYITPRVTVCNTEGRTVTFAGYPGIELLTGQSPHAVLRDGKFERIYVGTFPVPGERGRVGVGVWLSPGANGGGRTGIADELDGAIFF